MPLPEKRIQPDPPASPAASTLPAPRPLGADDERFQPADRAAWRAWLAANPGKLDDERTMLRFTPRKRSSAWSRPNKERVERLIANGSMTAAGLRLIGAARADGSWDALNDVEELRVPDDLAAALAGDAMAARFRGDERVDEEADPLLGQLGEAAGDARAPSRGDPALRCRWAEPAGVAASAARVMAAGSHPPAQAGSIASAISASASASIRARRV